MPASSPAVPLLVVVGLTKRYGAKEAVAGVDFEMAPGEIVGLLGVNGAGKTSLIECIAGLAEADAGTVHIAGTDTSADPRAARRLCGVALQTTGLPPRLTVRETLGLFAALQGGGDPDGLIDRFRLRDKAGACCETLSGGQRQRLALALALLGDPPLLILDEPGTGLDPAIRADFHADVEALRDAGRGILIATHDIAEASRLCDRIVVMDAGRVVATGKPDGLVQAAGGMVRLRVRTRPDLPPELAAQIACDGAVHRDAGDALFLCADPRPVLARLGDLLAAHDMALLSVTSETTRLEDLVLAIMRRGDG